MTEKGKLGAVVSGLIVSLLLILSMGILPVVPVSAGNTVGMVIEPTPKIVTVNDTFSVDIKVTISGGEAVCVAEAHINFDTAYLEVVSIEAGTALPTVLSSTFNNTTGTIDYTAGAVLEGTPPAPTSDFVLATMNLKAKAVTAATPLTFVFNPTLRGTAAYVGLVDSLSHSEVANGTVIINPAAASRLEVTGNATMTAGDSSELTITAKDQYGNVATSYIGTKSLTFSGPGMAPGGQPPTVEGTVIGSVIAVNFTDGISNAGAATLVAYKAETTTVDVSDGSINSTSGGYGLHLIVNPKDISKLVFITTAQIIIAGQPSAVMTVQAQDVYGNPVSVTNATTINLTTSNSATGKFYSDAAGSNLTTSVSISSGVNSTSFYYKDTLAGTPTVTAAESPSQGWADASQAENVKAAAASELVVSGITDPVKAGAACSVTVTAVDAYGNTDTTYAGTIHFTSSDGKATLPADYTFVAATDNGSYLFVGEVILETAGEQSVTATDTVTGSITGQQAEITVTGGGGGTPWGAIIGGIIGGLLVIGIIVYLLWIRKRT